MLTEAESQPINIIKYLEYMSVVTVAVAVTNPIELVKTRLQTSHEHMLRKSINQPYISAIETTRRILSH
jgi:hypothetical protein